MKQLRIHVFQHVDFEGIGCVQDWINTHGHRLTLTPFYKNSDLPQVTDIDWLIIMGGPMSIHDENQYPWLVTEKQFIKKAIESGKTVVGFCLGAQLIAAVLGAQVFKNTEKEIGWFPIEQVQNTHFLLTDLPKEINVFHWHGETFDLPKNAVHLFRSEACENQSFVYNTNVLAFQFHIEVTQDGVLKMTENCRQELVEGKFIQPLKHILENQQHIQTNNAILLNIFDQLASIN